MSKEETHFFACPDCGKDCADETPHSANCRRSPAGPAISPGLDSAIQDELDHPPASIMEEGK